MIRISLTAMMFMFLLGACDSQITAEEDSNTDNQTIASQNWNEFNWNESNWK